jgi:hypothetical protein
LDADLTLNKLFLVLNDLSERIFAMDVSMVLYRVLAREEGIHCVNRNWVFKIIHKYRFLENTLDIYLNQLPEGGEAIRSHLAEREIADTYTKPIGELDENELLSYTYFKQSLSKDRVETKISLTCWMGC